MDFTNCVSESFNAISLVRFEDIKEENPDKHFGILFKNGSILCLCCGGYIWPGDYKLIEDYKGFSYLDDTLKMYY